MNILANLATDKSTYKITLSKNPAPLPSIASGAPERNLENLVG